VEGLVSAMAVDSAAAWRSRRALVTGATGMIGSWLVKELLAAGAEVTALVRDADPRSELARSGDLDRCAIVSGELEDLRVVERAVVDHEVEVVFHLGAQTIVGAAQRAPLATFEANVRGTYHILEACRRAPVKKVVIASSDKAYGDHGDRAYREDMPLLAKHPYEVSKSCGEAIARCYGEVYGLAVAIVRSANVYGGGDLNWSRLIPGTIRSLLHGERPVIRSDGTYLRDYIHVTDVARGYLLVAATLERDGGAVEAFNFGNESPRAVLAIVDELRRITRRPELEPDVRGSATGEIRSQSVSAEKARRVLGWSPRHDLATGLAETVDWYRRFFAEASA
jgi:CDP-glucose 4,6-dehydratase